MAGARWRAIPPGDRFLFVRFGTWKSFADGAQPRIDDAGHFALPLPADSPGPDARVEFRSGVQGLVGRVVAVDQPGHRVFVEHPAVRFVELRVEPRRPGRWMLHLYVDGQDGTPWQMLNHTLPSRALVPEGMSLHGALLEDDAGSPRLPTLTTAFVTLDGSQREVTIRGSGHWCAIRLERQGTKAVALLLDPQRRPSGVRCHIEPSGACRLWVPDGASGIQVRLEPGGAQDFDAARDEITLR
ncbi:MAG TPA: hypothetical protein VFD82_03210 [Planctomycetota bacterium]|nr:hypothetical protein [Planctomycetota bacterium]